MANYQRYKLNKLCPSCGQTAESHFVECAACREKGKLSLRNRAATRKANGLCLFCGKENDNKPKVRCLYCSDRNKAYAAKGKKRTPEQTKYFRDRLKKEVFAAYGGVICLCCGETDVRFLTLDHTNNNGNEHRKELKAKGIYHIYSYLKREGYPRGFQVLCFNCNCGKNVNGGMCPHQDASRMNVWQLVENATRSIGSIVPMLQ